MNAHIYNKKPFSGSIHTDSAFEKRNLSKAFEIELMPLKIK
ncbi:MAG: hypothetical protein JWO44_1896 [Bacteroidetes bacterium]|nr:hypothetical protein [Bacteroidota bacterium]